MTLEEKDLYIEKELMELEPDTLRYMVADLTAALQDTATLRDQFAIASMDIARLQEQWREEIPPSLTRIAARAYDMADAMLVARSK